MATAIPSSMTFEMLSRLPANSFVQVWQEIRPSVAPAGNLYQVGTTSQRVNFVVRGAPNEFLLNTNCYVSGSAYTKTLVDQSKLLTGGDINALKYASPVVLNKPIHFFQSSRESFNSGSLPYLDNQDPVASHEYNELRSSLTQRNQPRGWGEQSLEDCESWLGSFKRYQGTGTATETALRAMESSTARFVVKNAATTSTVVNSGKPKDFRIPLGLFSNLVNSHSVIPIGLMSSYSVNGWQIDLDITNQQQGQSYGKVFEAEPTVGLPTAGEVGLSQSSAVIADLRMYVCLIRVLDPSVMEAVLSLYEKREMVNVGGVQFPLSLRLNSLGYRFARFPLSGAGTGQTDYFFRITGTDRSVRALAWRVYDTTQNAVGEWSLGYNGPLDASAGFVCTRLETTIGSERPHPVIEDSTAQTQNVSNFIALNIKRSGCLYSALPYYQEGVKHDGDASDVWTKYNNVQSTIAPPDTGYLFRDSLCQGLISFENLDRREGDFSGSFQASGKDLTNVGAIELRMRFQKVQRFDYNLPQPSPDVCDTLGFAPLGQLEQNYQIVFAYVYDSVMEISPQGVMDITNATL